MSDSKETLTILVAQEGKAMVATCVEHWLAGEGDTAADALHAFADVLTGQIAIDTMAGVEPLSRTRAQLHMASGAENTWTGRLVHASGEFRAMKERAEKAEAELAQVVATTDQIANLFEAFEAEVSRLEARARAVRDNSEASELNQEIAIGWLSALALLRERIAKHGPDLVQM